MARSAELHKLTGVAGRLGAFVAERHPLALDAVLDVFATVAATRTLTDEAALEAVRPIFRRELATRLQAHLVPADIPETTPRTTAQMRVRQAHDELLDDCDGLLRRLAIEASLTAEERREILKGMV